MIPEGWRLAQLGELCSPKQWPTIGAKDMTPAGVPVFGANGFIGRYPTANHIGDTLVITCRGATCGEVSIVRGPSYITGNAMCLDDIDVSKADQTFLAEAIRFAGTKPLISGSAQPQIIRADVLRFTVKTPPLPEQRRIAEILSTWDRAIETVEALIANGRAKRNALEQSLLTGKRRLPGYTETWSVSAKVIVKGKTMLFKNCRGPSFRRLVSSSVRFSTTRHHGEDLSRGAVPTSLCSHRVARRRSSLFLSAIVKWPFASATRIYRSTSTHSSVSSAFVSR